MSIITISANLTEESSTKTLASIIHESIAIHDEDAKFISLYDYPIPICDGKKSFSDEHVKALSEKLEQGSGFVFATPIYNYSINSTLKSVIEHCGHAFKNKPIGFVCTAGGDKSYMSLMPTINSMMLDFRCIVLPRFVYVSSSNFNEDKTLTDPEILSRVILFAQEMTKLRNCLAGQAST